MAKVAEPLRRRRSDFADNMSNLTGRTPLQMRNATVAVIGAGDYIGGEIAKKFASEGFTVFAGRRNGAKLEPLVKEMVYVAVSVTNGCAYCIATHTEAARRAGMSEAMFGELMAVVGMAKKKKRLANGYRVPIDDALPI